MSTESADETTESPANDADSDGMFPTLQLAVAGKGRYETEVSRESHVDAIATHDNVYIDVTRAITGVEDFRSLTGLADYEQLYVRKQTLIEGVLGALEQPYTHGENVGEWSVQFHGSAAAWQAVLCEWFRDEGEPVDEVVDRDAIQAVSGLIESGYTDDGAVIAVLALIDRHDLDYDRQQYLTRLEA